MKIFQSITFHTKNLIAKSLLIRFNKIDEFIKVYDGTRYLVLFGSEKCDSIYNRIRYIISIKRGITYTTSHNYAKIKVDSYNSLSLEKRITICNVITLIESIYNNDKNNYYYNIFLENASYELPKK